MVDACRPIRCRPTIAEAVAERRLPQSIKCFEMPLRPEMVRPRCRSFIYCTRIVPADSFRAFAERARANGLAALDCELRSRIWRGK